MAADASLVWGVALQSSLYADNDIFHVLLVRFCYGVEYPATNFASDDNLSTVLLCFPIYVISYRIPFSYLKCTVVAE
jgi:hypothetical protein